MFRKIKDLWEWIEIYCERYIQIPYYNVKWGIKNFWKWKGVIWKDRNYDYHYLLNVMRFKIQDMLNEYNRVNRYIGQEKDKQSLQTCLYLLNRLVDQNYGENVFYFHDRKWGEIKVDWEETDNSDMLTLVTDRDNIVTEEDKEKERKEFLRLIKHENYLERQDIEYLFKLMSKHVRKWWI